MKNIDLGIGKHMDFGIGKILVSGSENIDFGMGKILILGSIFNYLGGGGMGGALSNDFEVLWSLLYDGHTVRKKACEPPIR